MTLIVAHKSEQGITIVSDTAVSFTSKSVATFCPAMEIVKSVILSSDLVIAAAGNLKMASSIIRECRGKGYKNAIQLDQVVSYLTDRHIQLHPTKPDECGVEFIVASGSPSFQVCAIKKGEATKGNFGWIGSQRAFSCFQKSLSVAQVPPEEKQRFAMQSVIHDSSVPEVNGLMVAIAYCADSSERTSSGFHYQSSVGLYQLDYEQSGEQGHVKATITEADRGGFAVSQAEAVDQAGQRHYAAYIPQGRFGVYYASVNGGLLEPEIIHESEGLGFHQRMRKRGILLKSLVNPRGLQMGFDPQMCHKWRRCLPQLVDVRIRPEIPPEELRDVLVNGVIVCDCCGKSMASPLQYAQHQCGFFVSNAEEMKQVTAQHLQAGIVYIEVKLQNKRVVLREKQYRIDGITIGIRLFMLVTFPYMPSMTIGPRE